MSNTAQNLPEFTPAKKPSYEVNNLKKRLYELLKKDEKLSKGVSFSFVVLSCAAQAQYERAINELDMVHVGLEDYKEFEVRARRYIDHSKSLVEAIKLKFTACMSEQASKSVQKELGDKIIDHFHELRKSVRAIEKIQKSVRSQDMSSTALFLRIFFFSVLMMFIAYTAFFVYPDFRVYLQDKVYSQLLWTAP